MLANAPSQTLSAAALATLRTAWLVDDCSITPVDADRRIRAYQTVAREIAALTRKQLVACGAVTLADWFKYRPIIIGYVSGMSEAILRESGESSRSAISMMYLSAMLALIGAEADEELMGTEAERLCRERQPAYLIGIGAADRDRAALRQERMATGLAAAILTREKSTG